MEFRVSRQDSAGVFPNLLSFFLKIHSKLTEGLSLLIHAPPLDLVILLEELGQQSRDQQPQPFCSQR